MVEGTMQKRERRNVMKEGVGTFLYFLACVDLKCFCGDFHSYEYYLIFLSPYDAD